MIRKLLVFVLLVVAVAAAGYYFLKDQEFSVNLTEEDLQERIGREFPVEEGQGVLRLRLSEPEVRLKEGSDRIIYRMKASVSALLFELRGEVRVSGGVRYEPETGSFFLLDPKLEELEIEKVPAEYRVPLRELVNVSTREVFEKYPVYTLDDRFSEKLRGMVMVRDVEVEDGKVRVSLGLAEKPWRGILERSAEKK